MVGDTLNPDYPFPAAAYCDGLSAHGHSDWYLPAQDELNVLYNARSTGDLNGTFDETNTFPDSWYWTSSEVNLGDARGMNFGDGTQGDLVANIASVQVRCVRRASDDGLVGHWKLDETSGNPLDSAGSADLSFNGNGPCAASTNTRSGIIDNSLYLGGAECAIEYSAAAGELGPDPSFSVGGWFKIDSINSAITTILQRGFGGGADTYSLTAFNTNDIAFVVHNSAGASNGTSGSTFITLGQWSHIMGVKDGTTLRLYLNGSEVETATFSGTNGATAHDFRIGEGFSDRIDMEADDVRYYNRALSATEIEVLSNCTGPGKYYYNFSDDVMQWCDDVNSAINMHTPASGVGGCLISEGTLNYNTDRFEACDGNGLLDIGK